MRIALFQPDIPQNTGTILRLTACMGTPVDIIGPLGFELSDRTLKRAGLDYLDRALIVRHESWEAYDALRRSAATPSRLILLSSHAPAPYTEFAFHATDTLLLGRESAGAPSYVHEAADHRITIPLLPGLRSLNIAVAAAMVLSEALRQTGGFPVRHAATLREPAP